jgi:hypothetical protein
MPHNLQRGVLPDASYTERFYWRVHPRYAQNATHVRIFEHASVDRVVLRALRYWRRVPRARSVLALLERRVGKSWYLYLWPINA